MATQHPEQHVKDRDLEILRLLALGDACPEGLVPDRSSFEVQMAVARRVMDDRRDALRALAEYDAGRPLEGRPE